MSNFLRGHVAAFEAWQGVPGELWYDILKLRFPELPNRQSCGPQRSASR